MSTFGKAFLGTIAIAIAASLTLSCGSERGSEQGVSTMSSDAGDESLAELQQDLLQDEGSRVLHLDSMEVDVSFQDLVRGSETIVVAEVGPPLDREPAEGPFAPSPRDPSTVAVQEATVEQVLRAPDGSVLAPGRVVTLVSGAVSPDNDLVALGRVVLPYGSTGVVPEGRHVLLLTRLTPGVAEAFLESQAEIGYTLASSHHPLTFLKVNGDDVEVATGLFVFPPAPDGGALPLDEASSRNLAALNPPREYDTPETLSRLVETVKEQPYDPSYEAPAEG